MVLGRTSLPGVGVPVVDDRGFIATPLLFVDLDGTVRWGYDELGRFVNGPSDVTVFPEAVEQLTLWRRDGGRVIAVSNQGGIALGHVTPEAVAEGMAETFRQCDEQIDLVCWCPHYPTAQDPMMQRCWCRKPRPGMAIEACYQLGQRHAEEQYPLSLALFVGDRPEDKACAETCNVDFLDAAAWRAGHLQRMVPFDDAAET